MTEKKTEDDGRKEDDGTAGPRPQGAKHGDEHQPELHARAKFLKDHEVKVVAPPAKSKTAGSEGAEGK